RTFFERRQIRRNGESSRRRSGGEPSELLSGAGVPPRVRQRDRSPGRGPEVAGCLPDHHHRLCLSLGRLEGEGVVRQFIIRRILYSIVTLLILSATIFLIVRLTGDPVALMAEASARPEDLDRIRHQWGLDRSWPVQ